MKIRNIFVAAAVMMMLSGCGLFKKYEQKVEAPSDAFGAGDDIAAAYGGTSLSAMTWREFFTDPLLQQLVDSVLASNTDLNSARIAVEKSEAALKSARLAYLPSLAFAPSGNLTRFDDLPWSKTYSLPLQLSIDIDFFGAITNKKRAAKAVLMQAQMRRDAVRVNLISTTAQQYYMLLLLDRELDILTQTDSLWRASLDTQRALWENGKAYSTAVNQLESSYLDVKTQIVDTHREIRAVENSICLLLGVTPRHIARSHWGTAALNHPEALGDAGQRMFNTDYLKIGVPATMLELRPDIRMANYAMEEAFYNTQVARAAFFPNVTLSGTLGWTNSAGGVVIDPGKMLLNFAGQLTQPIFARGKIRAAHKIAKLTEEDLRKKYVQTVINAGNEVNEAMADCQDALEKYGFYRRQVEVLREAYTGTHKLMDAGKASYLEVLTAQERLLGSQINEAFNLYSGARAVIALYIALGGGGE